MLLYACSWAVAVIGIILADAASAQEPPLPSAYSFSDSNAAVDAAFIDPHISNETKRQLAQLIEARRWPVEYQEPKTKLIWLYRPSMSPTLEGVRPFNTEAKKQKSSDSSPRARVGKHAAHRVRILPASPRSRVGDDLWATAALTGPDERGMP